MSELTGYADRASVEPGERVRFMLSTDRPAYDASVTRLLRGVSNARGPGLVEDVVAPALATGRAGRRQVVRAGSYVDAGDPEVLRAPAAFTLHAWIWPTMPGDGREQGLLSKWSPPRRAGYCLSVGADGRLRIRVGDGSTVAELAADAPLAARAWYFVAATFDTEAGRLALTQHALSPWADPRSGWWEAGAAVGLLPAHEAPLLIAAGGWDSAAVDLYDGKIDRPGISSRALARGELDAIRAGGADPAPAAAWDLGAEPAGHHAVDTGPLGLTGRLVNQPTRAVTGHNWTGRESDFRRAGEQYGAIYFHHDDVGDAAWEVGVEWTVPADARSGVYALRVEAGDDVDRIPFVVRPPREDAARSPVLVLLPTYTYLAYANLPLSISAQPNRPPDWAPPPEPADDALVRHPEFGGSLYHVHADGSGVVYSSALRPVPTTRPTYRASFIDGPRHLAGDLQLIAWLEAKGIAYDVVADDDLHARGAELLERYRVVLTGSHPEYATAAMLDALEGYVAGGGRLMYLGGNGFYWVTSVDPERPHVIEVRRGIAGSRPWESAPGELHHSTTGELGGLWRYRGALPNRLAGVAFSTEGVGYSGGYRRTEASRDADVAFVFEGVGDDEPIGEFGLVMGSAVGDELDRADPGLGTPPEARVLATSFDVASAYRPCVEDDLRWQAGREMGVPRADMVYLANARGGAVFSVGSISWIASLSHTGNDNNVSRITENVLRRFAELDGAAA